MYPIIWIHYPYKIGCNFNKVGNVSTNYLELIILKFGKKSCFSEIKSLSVIILYQTKQNQYLKKWYFVIDINKCFHWSKYFSK